MRTSRKSIFARNVARAVCAASFVVVIGSGAAVSAQSLIPGLLGADQLPDKPAGSVVPVISMAEQILPCLATAPAKGDDFGVRALVNVDGIENDEGNIRVQVYGENPDEFLESGKKLLRVDVLASAEDPKVCVTFPEAGTYALVVMHDRNANGRADILTEGFGFSRNPELGFSKPDHEEVAVAFAEGVTELDVALNYMFRLENKERRRRRRR